MHWEIVPTRVPYSRKEWEAADATAWDVRLTPAGNRKLLASAWDAQARLRPGACALRPTVGAQRGSTAFSPRRSYGQPPAQLVPTTSPATEMPALCRLPRPQGLRRQRGRQRTAHANILSRVDTQPCAGDRRSSVLNLLGQHNCWEDSLRHWLHRLPCAEAKRNVGNFLSVYRVRPSADADGNSEDDAADEALILTTAQLSGALCTQRPAASQKQGPAHNDDRAHRVEEAMRQADALWSPIMCSDACARGASATYAALSSEAARKATRAQPAKKLDAMAMQRTHAAAVRPAPESMTHTVRSWMAELATKDACNAEQRSFCARARVLQELHDRQLEPGQPWSKPLRWVLHGGPGTGKSHTLKMLRRELFEETLGWTHGVHFQVVSFQAVMAELLDGDTIHHALGLDWAGDRNQNMLRTLRRTQETLQWRWLILDEFSMVSAELLAQLEQRCREIMRDLSLAKFAADGSVEPFGGLNVILSGDLYQLPPPKGTFLGDVPWDLSGKKTAKQATALHGQTLLWGGPAVGVQGLTELHRCMRTGDTWLTEVQEQLRHGDLCRRTTTLSCTET